MKMIDMKLDPKKAEEMMKPDMGEKPEYPWGLRLSLDKDEITKLGLGKCKPTDEMEMHARVRVKSVSASESDDGSGHASCELQIQEMALEKASRMTEDEMAGALYGGKEK